MKGPSEEWTQAWNSAYSQTATMIRPRSALAPESETGAGRTTGPDRRTRLSAAERRELERAQRDGVLITRARRPNLYLAYREWCEAQGQPYVCAQLKQRFATVLVDTLPARRPLSTEAQETIDRLWSGVADFTLQYYYVGPYRCGNASVRTQQAESVAAAIYAIAVRDLRSGSRSELR